MGNERIIRTSTDKFTPRQRCAIMSPVVDSLEVPHVRHLRRNGNVQSILTFDVLPVSNLEGAPASIVDRSVDEWYGLWHARVSTHPYTALEHWDTMTIAKATGVIQRLVNGCGLDLDVEAQNGSDLSSVHIYKWATHVEVRLAEHLLGHKFSLRREAKS